MAKKFVRGITDVKTINNQDFDTNNVNDLLSDGQYNYIHRKKGKTEEYHNLTDNIKTISSDNTELLSVTNNNKTTNTATLSPKHDKQKEQLLESTRDTITINHGTNGTAEKTTVDTNPQKVLEHENLIAGSYITKTTSANTSTLKVSDDFVAIVNGKQNKLNGNTSIGFLNNELQQLYSWFQEYNNDNAVLKTHVKSISNNTNLRRAEEEFNFILKINQGSQNVTFTLNEHDKSNFNRIISAYGVGNSVRINDCLFTLSEASLTVETDANTGSNYVTTFSVIV